MVYLIFKIEIIKKGGSDFKKWDDIIKLILKKNKTDLKKWTGA